MIMRARPVPSSLGCHLAGTRTGCALKVREMIRAFKMRLEYGIMTRLTIAMVAVSAMAVWSANAATVEIDFASELGPVKPVNGVGQPPMIGAPANFEMMHYLKDAGIPYSRLHDVGGWFGGDLYADIPNIFRDFSADENDPANYDFAFTDALIKALKDNGIEPFFRLGVTIENFAECGFKARRAKPPSDFARGVNLAVLDTPNQRIAQAAKVKADRLNEIYCIFRDCRMGAWEKPGAKGYGAYLLKVYGENKDKLGELRAEADRILAELREVRPVSCRLQVRRRFPSVPHDSMGWNETFGFVIIAVL